MHDVEIVFESLRYRVVVGEKPTFQRARQFRVPLVAQQDGVHGYDEFTAHHENDEENVLEQAREKLCMSAIGVSFDSRVRATVETLGPIHSSRADQR